MKHLLSVSAFVARRQIQNRGRRFAKNPRYLVSATFGALYFLWSSGWRLSGRTANTITALLPDDSGEVARSPLFLLFGSLIVFLYLTVVWLVSSSRPAFAFTRAEAQFFFPAPITGRALLQERASRTVMSTFLLAASVTVVFVRTSNLFFSFVGLWLAFAILALHRFAASLMLARFGPKARLSAWLALVGLGAAATVDLWQSSGSVAAPFMPRSGSLLDAAASALPLRMATHINALTPAAMLFSPIFAKSWSAFVTSLSAPACLLVAHFLWATHIALPVEEFPVGEVAVTPGNRDANRRRRARVWGRHVPWLAIAWKNDIAWRQQFSRSGTWVILLLLGLGGSVGPVAVTGQLSLLDSANSLAATALAVAVLVALVGPQVLHYDFRSDVSKLETLRSLPLTARELVMGEVAAPFVRMTFIECAFTSAGSLLALGFNPTERSLIACASFAMVVALPILTLLGLLSRNAVALLFPRWTSMQARGLAGFEETGARIMATVGSSLFLAIAVAPLAVAGGLTTVCLWDSGGPGALIVASLLLGSMGIALNCLGIRILASLFENM